MGQKWGQTVCAIQAFKQMKNFQREELIDAMEKLLLLDGHENRPRGIGNSFRKDFDGDLLSLSGNKKGHYGF